MEPHKIVLSTLIHFLQKELFLKNICIFGHFQGLAEIAIEVVYAEVHVGLLNLSTILYF